MSSVAGELFFEQSGDGAGTPLVCVHGGPGFTGYYLEPLFELSSDQPVICYDQAGSGRSRERCPDRRLHTVDAFVDELEALRVARGLEKMHLLGHSFGGLSPESTPCVFQSA